MARPRDEWVGWSRDNRRHICLASIGLFKKLARYGIKITVGVGEAVAPSSPTEKKGEESPNSKGQDGR